MDTFKDQPLLCFETSQDWREWLQTNHESVSSVWLKLAKKGSGAVSLTYEEARDNAIAFGWIDGLINRFDEQFYVTRFTPRKPKSIWSKINCDIAEALVESGAMHPSGQKHVDAAKKDGRWDRAYEGASKIAVPSDFQDALDASPDASGAFDAANAANRYAFLFRVQTAGTPVTRAKRIAKFIVMLENGELFHP